MTHKYVPNYRYNVCQTCGFGERDIDRFDEPRHSSALPAGTKVTANGEPAELIVDWFPWERDVLVYTLQGRQYWHPSKVFMLDGTSLADLPSD
jgi:hypothetical protein